MELKQKQSNEHHNLIKYSTINGSLKCSIGIQTAEVFFFSFFSLFIHLNPSKRNLTLQRYERCISGGSMFDCSCVFSYYMVLIGKSYANLKEANLFYY